MARIGRTLGAALVAWALVACGSGNGSPPQAVSSPSPTAAPTAAPSPSPSGCAIDPLPGLCVGRRATPSEQAQMVAAGASPAEADLGLKDASTCQNGDRCFQVGGPARAMVGDHAGTFYGQMYTMGGGGGAGCWVFLFEDASGWHFDSARCAQATGSTPGLQSLVWVSGCANVRSAPQVNGPVIDCLKNGSQVDVDSAPVYADGHIWWHLAGRGWMAHEFLIQPKAFGKAFAD